jgi:hypothetical protein
MGRPAVELSEEEITQVESLAAVLNQEQLSDFFGFSDRTFRELMKRDERVSAAYKRGKAKAIGKIAQSLMKQAHSGNTVAMMFYLKTQAGWRETNRHEHTGADGGALEISWLTKPTEDAED